MKRILCSLMIVLLLGVLVASAPMALAQIPGNPAYSGMQVLNLGTSDATISIYYYNQDGSLPTLPSPYTNPVMDTVKVGESNTYFPVHAADGFNGSVVIASSEPVAVISNILYTSPAIQSSWTGFAEGGSSLLFPLVMKGNNYNDTTFNVQNATGDSVDILIEFIPEPGKGYAAIADVTDTIAAFAAHTYDQRTMTEFSAVTKWVGSARVTVQGSGAVVGVAQQIDSSRKTGTAYNGFLEGAAEVTLPLIMDNNNNMWTSINCQNLGPGTTTVNVEFVPEAGYPAKASESISGVVESGNAVFLQDPFGDQWVGSAEVTNTEGNPLACVANQLNLVQYFASAYEGFDPTEATGVTSVVAPLFQYQAQADGELYTAVNVQNLSDSTTTDIVLDFVPAPGFTDVPNMTKSSIGPGELAVFFCYQPYGNQDKFIGGAEVTAATAGVPLAMVVNQAKTLITGDIYSTYDAFNNQ